MSVHPRKLDGGAHDFRSSDSFFPFLVPPGAQPIQLGGKLSKDWARKSPVLRMLTPLTVTPEQVTMIPGMAHLQCSAYHIVDPWNPRGQKVALRPTPCKAGFLCGHLT